MGESRKKTEDGEVANGWIHGLKIGTNAGWWKVCWTKKKMVDGEETNDGKNNGWRAKW